MAQNSVLPSLKKDACAKGEWKITNWNNTHKVAVAAGANCYIEVGSPKVALRFFLRPKEKLITVMQGNYPILMKWYSLCAEVLTQVNENVAVEVTANFSNVSSIVLTRGIYKEAGSAKGTAWSLVNANLCYFILGGVIPIYKSKGKVVEVVDHFIYFESSTMDGNGELGAPKARNTIKSGGVQTQLTDVTIAIVAQLFRWTENKKIDPLDPVVEERTDAETSLIHDLKNMFVAHENYADLKLESKDHMTLDAHKFVVAARSRYLQKCIDDAMKDTNFNGTLKMNINGKPLVVILHWMYTGELHENSGNVMEEVVDAAILFELTHLMKLLDKKLITICNKENMFRLYQVAQKNGMPNAMDDVTVYIREHL